MWGDAVSTPSWAKQPDDNNQPQPAPGQQYGPPQPAWGQQAPGHQPPPPPGWAQQPEPPKKKNQAAKYGCFGCLGVIGLFVVIAVIAAAVGGSSNSGGSSTTAAAPSGSASASHSTAAKQAAPAKTKTQAPAKPRTVLTESGNGIKDTAKFTVSGDWDLQYSFDCSNFGQSGNFSVYEDYPDGDILTNELAKKGTDVTHEHEGGTHWLKVSSECSWKIKVVDVP